MVLKGMACTLPSAHSLVFTNVIYHETLRCSLEDVSGICIALRCLVLITMLFSRLTVCHISQSSKCPIWCQQDTFTMWVSLLLGVTKYVENRNRSTPEYYCTGVLCHHVECHHLQSLYYSEFMICLGGLCGASPYLPINPQHITSMADINHAIYNSIRPSDFHLIMRLQYTNGSFLSAKTTT
jgi:hypothetical protein